MHPYEPTPFRREQLEGRSFAYDGMSFLHRLSYQPMPYLGQLRPVPDKVLQGTFGSISGDEFYTRIEAAAHIPLEGPFYAGYRFRRDEDFDGRFDWNLIGMGLELGEWRLSFWGDVVAEKEAIDAHLDIAWKDLERNLFRIVWVMPDMVFNRKNETAIYEPRPYTIFMRGERWVTDRLGLKGFLQINNRTVLRDKAEGVRRKNKAHSGGGSVEFRMNNDVAVEIYAEGLTGDRSQENLFSPVEHSLFSPVANDYNFDRLFRSATAEIRWLCSGGFPQWAGLRYLTFQESWAGQTDSTFDSEENRQETTLYWGREIPLQGRLTFIPSVFLGYHEIDQLGLRSGGSEEDWTTADFYGKFAPAWRWVLKEETGAHLTLLISARLHRPAFGGGNLQMVFPF